MNGDYNIILYYNVQWYIIKLLIKLQKTTFFFISFLF